MADINPAKVYWIQGQTLKKLLDRKNPVAGKGLVSMDVGDNRTLALAPQTSRCALSLEWRTRENQTGWWTTPGHITTGYNTVAVGAQFLGAWDTATRAGRSVWLQCEVAGEVSNTVLQTKITLDTVAWDYGTDVPDNILPVWDDLTGLAHVPVGRFDDDADATWIPSGCGDIYLLFCIGAFLHRRV